MMFALKKVGVLRVSKAGELEGLDLHEHGASAYPEYALASVSASFNDQNSRYDGHKLDAAPELEDIPVASSSD
jgi:hypothetical protein